MVHIENTSELNIVVFMILNNGEYRISYFIKTSSNNLCVYTFAG